MKRLWSCGAAVALACLAPALAPADEAKAASYEVPYRLTVPKHIMVRAKINGKGPFNFILDTGAPALFLHSKAAQKIGVEPDKTGWATFDRFEIEGGVVVDKARARIEDLFQLEGMNGLGLAGAELHGVIGYNVLAKFRMEIDFTRDKMTWVPLDWQPKAPMGLGGKGAGGGLEMIGQLMKVLGGLAGKKAMPETAARGFLGVELADKDEVITILAVLKDGPADKAGVKGGDKLVKFDGRTVLNVEDVHRLAKKMTVGQTIKVTVERGGEKKDVTVKLGEGL
jgi:hypothetical protein